MKIYLIKALLFFYLMGAGFFQVAFAMLPGDSPEQITYEEGSAYLLNQEFKRAIEKFNELLSGEVNGYGGKHVAWLEQDNNRAQVHYDRGVANHEFGDLNRALDDFNEVLRTANNSLVYSGFFMRPSDIADAYYLRGTINFKLKHFADFLRDCDELLRLEVVPVRQGAGAAQGSLIKNRYADWLNKNDNYGNIRYQMSEAFYELGRFEDSLKILNMFLGENLSQIREKNKCEDWLIKPINQLKVRLLRGRTNFMLSKYKEAMEDFNYLLQDEVCHSDGKYAEFLDQDNNRARIHAYRGIAYKELKDFEKALYDLSAFVTKSGPEQKEIYADWLSKGDNSAVIYDNLSEIYLEKKEFRQALSYVSRLLEKGANGQEVYADWLSKRTNRADTYYHRVAAYIRMQDNTFVVNGDFIQVLQAINCLLEKGADGKEVYDTWLKQGNNRAQVLFYRGVVNNANVREGGLKLALQDFNYLLQKAADGKEVHADWLNKNDNYANVRYQMSKAFFMLGQHGEVLKILRIFLEGNLSAAEIEEKKRCENWLAKPINQFKAHLLRGKVRFMRKEYNEAIEDFNFLLQDEGYHNGGKYAEFLDQDNNRALIHAYRGKAYRGVNNFYAALCELNAFVTKSGPEQKEIYADWFNQGLNRPLIYNDLIEIYLENKEFRRALSYANLLLKKREDGKEVYYSWLELQQGGVSVRANAYYHRIEANMRMQENMPVVDGDFIQVLQDINCLLEKGADGKEVYDTWLKQGNNRAQVLYYRGVANVSAQSGDLNLALQDFTYLLQKAADGTEVYAAWLDVEGNRVRVNYYIRVVRAKMQGQELRLTKEEFGELFFSRTGTAGYWFSIFLAQEAHHANALYARSLKMLEEGRLTEALEDLNEFLKGSYKHIGVGVEQEDKYAALLFNRGMVHYKLGNDVLALKDFDELLSKERNGREKYIVWLDKDDNRGKVYAYKDLSTARKNAASSEDTEVVLLPPAKTSKDALEDAIAMMDVILDRLKPKPPASKDLDPGLTKIHLEQIEQGFSQGNYEQAIEHLSKLLSGERDFAYGAYSAWLDINSNRLQVHYCLGWAYLKQRKIAAALREFNLLEEEFKKNTGFWSYYVTDDSLVLCLRSLIYLLRGELNLALVDSKAVVSCENSKPYYHANVREEGKDIVYQKNPDVLSFSHYIWGVTSLKLGYFGEAVYGFENLLKQHNGNIFLSAEAHYGLGLARMEQKKFREAIKSFNELVGEVHSVVYTEWLQQGNNCAEVCYHRGAANMALGNFSEALEDFAEILRVEEAGEVYAAWLNQGNNRDIVLKARAQARRRIHKGSSSQGSRVTQAETLFSEGVSLGSDSPIVMPSLSAPPTVLTISTTYSGPSSSSSPLTSTNSTTTSITSGVAPRASFAPTNTGGQAGASLKIKLRVRKAPSSQEQNKKGVVAEPGALPSQEAVVLAATTTSQVSSTQSATSEGVKRPKVETSLGNTFLEGITSGSVGDSHSK